MLEVRGATKIYGGSRVLDAVDLEVAAGETVVLLGPSGCGKSTLLRGVIGLVPLDGGAVSIGGEPVTAFNAAAIRRKVGYVIQSGGLFPHLTAWQNVTLAAEAFGRDRGWINDRIDALRGLVRLTTKQLGRRPSRLSGGQRQRVALMRALVLEPEVLLLDEPLGALDPMIRAELQADLRGLFARLGCAVLLVTHDLREARELGDRVALMRAGRVEQAGAFDDLVERPASDFVQAFVSAQR